MCSERGYQCIYFHRGIVWCSHMDINLLTARVHYNTHHLVVNRSNIVYSSLFVLFLDDTRTLCKVLWGLVGIMTHAPHTVHLQSDSILSSCCFLIVIKCIYSWCAGWWSRTVHIIHNFWPNRITLGVISNATYTSWCDIIRVVSCKVILQ